MLAFSLLSSSHFLFLTPVPRGRPSGLSTPLCVLRFIARRGAGYFSDSPTEPLRRAVYPLQECFPPISPRLQLLPPPGAGESSRPLAAVRPAVTRPADQPD